MADKRNGKLPLIWGDNSNLRMTGGNCPPIDEEALYKRVLASEATLRQEAEDLIDYITERYSGRD